MNEGMNELFNVEIRLARELVYICIGNPLNATAIKDLQDE